MTKYLALIGLLALAGGITLFVVGSSGERLGIGVPGIMCLIPFGYTLFVFALGRASNDIEGIDIKRRNKHPRTEQRQTGRVERRTPATDGVS